MRITILLVATTALSAGTLSSAQAQTARARHDKPSDEIIVTAPYERARGDVLSGTSVVSGDDLTRALRPTIGETLAHQPGVSATSFGPNASRPVLRGFQGERIRVLTDGIGSIDVSNTSVDHPVVINQLTADRIEILRGPAALLFGSSAIGGVVNVVDSRIPRRVPDEAVHIDAIGTYGSAAAERSAGGVVAVPIGKFVVHADASYARTSDLRTGGYILSPALRAQALASPDPAIRTLATQRGALNNSAARTWDVAGGGAFIDDGGTLGFAVSHYASLYGIPVRSSLDPAITAEQVRLDVNQTRVDARAEINVRGALLDKIRFRGSFADYKHDEIDPEGAINTTFLNQGWEGRLELIQKARGGWQGAVGAQFAIRDFNIIGTEAFVPRNTTHSIGLFTLQSIDSGAWKGEFGGRFEQARVQSEASAVIGNAALTRRFTALSGSAGVSYALAEPVRIGLSLSHTERAPSAEELLANGPHAGTQAFEIGNPDFRVEKSNGIEATLRVKRDGFNLSLAAYHSWFSDYIFEAQTGDVRDGLPVFRAVQADARYLGFEGEAMLRLFNAGRFTISADAIGDYTRATIIGGTGGAGAGNSPVPRIPALRLLGGLEGKSHTFDWRGEIEWTDRATRIAPSETPTAGFTMVNASVTWHPKGPGSGTSLTVSANNLFDVEARRHASVLKDYAPLPGRDIRVNVRIAI
jgi:iron complex outermembrane recepter protein